MAPGDAWAPRTFPGKDEFLFSPSSPLDRRAGASAALSEPYPSQDGCSWFIIKIILKSSHGTNRDNLIRGGLSKFLTCFLAEPGEMSPSKAAANVSSRKSLEPGPGVPGKFQVSSAPNLGLEPQAQNHPVSHHFSAGTKSPSLPSRPSVGLYVGVWGVNVSSVEPRRSLEEVHKA